MSAPSEWRLGRHYQIHVYEGDRPVATFQTVLDAKRCVAAVNATNHTAQLADALELAADKMQCACSPLERHSGHLTDCWMPEVRAAVEAALAKAEGGLP